MLALSWLPEAGRPGRPPHRFPLRSKLCLAFLLTSAPGLLCAQSFEIWNGGEAELVNRNRLQLRLRGEYRTSDMYRNFLSLRGIVEAKVPLWKHLSAFGQYQAVETRGTLLGWDEYNRATGGAEFPFESRHLTVTGRVAGEHFWYGGKLDYDRHRERVLFRMKDVRFQPQCGVELFADSRGWAGTRLITGALFPIHGNLILDAGYYYDWRPPNQGGDRHILYTFFRLRRPRG